MALRKAVIQSSALTDNAGSFVNVTADRLHIRLLDLVGYGEVTDAAIGDRQSCSIDEVPVDQHDVNDSRSHIMSANTAMIGGTAALSALPVSKVLPFNRNDMVLDPDEAIFMNISDIKGALDYGWTLNVWYED